MKHELRADLKQLLTQAHECGACVVPATDAESHRLRRALLRGDVISPAEQVYALADYWDELKPLERERQRLRALAKRHPNWVFADVSAAVIHGLDVSYSLLGTTHLAREKNSHTRSTSKTRNHAIHNDSYVQVDGVRVTSLFRTVFDCTRAYAFPMALGIADSAIRVTGIPKEAFMAEFGRMHKSHRNVWRAIDTLGFADGLAENGGESYARAMMISMGYMLPQLQVEVPNRIDVGTSYYVDFYWDLGSYKVAGELDGREKYVNPAMTGNRSMVDVLADERLRESRISASLRVMRFSFRDVQTPHRFASMLTSYGIPSGEAVPRVALPGSL